MRRGEKRKTFSLKLSIKSSTFTHVPGSASEPHLGTAGRSSKNIRSPVFRDQDQAIRRNFRSRKFFFAGEPDFHRKRVNQS
jgi:hypothetical protein